MDIKKASVAISTLLLLLAVLFWFTLPPIIFSLFGISESASFIDITFGNGDGIEFSIWNFIGFLLLLVSAGLSIILLVKRGNVSDLFLLGTSVLSLTSGIFAILSKTFFMAQNNDTDYDFSRFVQLGPASYLCLVFCILAAISLIIPKFVEYSKK